MTEMKMVTNERRARTRTLLWRNTEPHRRFILSDGAAIMSRPDMLTRFRCSTVAMFAAAWVILGCSLASAAIVQGTFQYAKPLDSTTTVPRAIAFGCSVGDG